jgi:hypothetical protein
VHPIVAFVADSFTKFEFSYLLLEVILENVLHTKLTPETVTRLLHCHKVTLCHLTAILGVIKDLCDELFSLSTLFNVEHTCPEIEESGSEVH